jgi:hypothetical protein
MPRCPYDGDAGEENVGRYNSASPCPVYDPLNYTRETEPSPCYSSPRDGSPVSDASQPDRVNPDATGESPEPGDMQASPAPSIESGDESGDESDDERGTTRSSQRSQFGFGEQTQAQVMGSPTRSPSEEKEQPKNSGVPSKRKRSGSAESPETSSSVGY